MVAVTRSQSETPGNRRTQGDNDVDQNGMNGVETREAGANSRAK